MSFQSKHIMRDATLPVLLIVGGFALLAWNFGWIPDWNTLIAIAFVCAGIAVMVFDGITKKSLVAGPILIAAGLGWYGYFELGWRSRLVIPAFMIFSGFMMLIARFAPITETKERGMLAPRDKDATRF
jgi:hypothetical protein